VKKHKYDIRKELLARINDSTFDQLKIELGIDKINTNASQNLNDDAIDTSIMSSE